MRYRPVCLYQRFLSPDRVPGSHEIEIFMNHKNLNSLISVLLGICFTALPLPGADGTNVSSASHRPDLEYLKAVNQVSPPRDPQMLFLLMAQYASANRQAEGAEFFSARLREFEPRLTDVQRALYLSAIGLLR